MKLTPFFGPTVKPVRKGVYQRRHKTLHFMVYSYWDGEQWFLGAKTPHLAEIEPMLSMNQNKFMWRGIHG